MHKRTSSQMCSRVLHTPLRYLDIGFPFNCPWKEQSIKSLSEQSFEWGNARFPIDTGRKLNVHKIFKRWPGRLLNVLCTLHLRPVSTGLIYVKWQKKISNLLFDRVTWVEKELGNAIADVSRNILTSTKNSYW